MFLDKIHPYYDNGCNIYQISLNTIDISEVFSRCVKCNIIWELCYGCLDVKGALCYGCLDVKGALCLQIDVLESHYCRHNISNAGLSLHL